MGEGAEGAGPSISDHWSEVSGSTVDGHSDGHSDGEPEG